MLHYFHTTSITILNTILPHHHVATFLHYHITTLLHSYIATFLHCYIPTFLHCYIATLLHCYITTFIYYITNIALFTVILCIVNTEKFPF